MGRLVSALKKMRARRRRSPPGCARPDDRQTNSVDDGFDHFLSRTAEPSILEDSPRVAEAKKHGGGKLWFSRFAWVAETHSIIGPVLVGEGKGS